MPILLIDYSVVLDYETGDAKRIVLPSGITWPLIYARCLNYQHSRQSCLANTINSGEMNYPIKSLIQKFRYLSSVEL